MPKIKASPAYRDHGAIMVTFDESETGAESCCNEPLGPNTLQQRRQHAGNGGGRVGAVIESPCIKPGTISLDDYNHFAALRWMEDNWAFRTSPTRAPKPCAPSAPMSSRIQNATPASRRARRRWRWWWKQWGRQRRNGELEAEAEARRPT